MLFKISFLSLSLHYFDVCTLPAKAKIFITAMPTACGIYKKAEGVILGRPKGSKSKVKKLTGKEAEIKNLLDKKVSKSAIARILGVHRLTVAEFVKEIL